MVKEIKSILNYLVVFPPELMHLIYYGLSVIVLLMIEDTQQIHLGIIIICMYIGAIEIFNSYYLNKYD